MPYKVRIVFCWLSTPEQAFNPISYCLAEQPYASRLCTEMQRLLGRKPRPIDVRP
jgi:hypothetical protein